MIISNDKKHDQHAVQRVVGLANNHLIACGVNIEHEVHFTDDAPSQYKSRLNFVDKKIFKKDRPV